MTNIKIPKTPAAKMNSLTHKTRPVASDGNLRSVLRRTARFQHWSGVIFRRMLIILNSCRFCCAYRHLVLLSFCAAQPVRASCDGRLLQCHLFVNLHLSDSAFSRRVLLHGGRIVQKQIKGDHCGKVLSRFPAAPRPPSQ